VDPRSGFWKFWLIPLKLCLLFAVGLTAGSAFAAENGALRMRAEALAAQGRCEEALALVRDAQASFGEDARLKLISGQCLIQLQRFADAVEQLEAARTQQPELPGVDLYLGIARFHLGDLAAAEEAIAAARQRDPNGAEVNLYWGLLLLQRAQNGQAAAYLERARLANAAAVEPVASYYTGIAWLGAEDRARGEAALRRVVEEAPNSSWAEEARRALEKMREHEAGRWWATLTGGFEYDNNVLLRGSGVSLPSEISSQRDTRFMWLLEGGYEFYRSRRWTLGALLRYYGNEHDDLGNFEIHYPTLTFWADYHFGRGLTGRIQYDGGYAWVDNDPFLSSHNFTTSLYQDWGQRGRTQLFANYYRYDYKFDNSDVPDGPGFVNAPCLDIDDIVCAPPGINESTARNRDGYGSSFGAEHAFPLGDSGVELRGGYRFHLYSSRGSEYSYTGHELKLGLQIQLPWDLVLDLLGRYTYKPYRNHSTFPDPEDLFLNRQYGLANHVRRDKVYEFEVQLERRLTDRLSAALRYSYLRNRSNVAVFDYRREVIGAYLTFKFQDLGV